MSVDPAGVDTGGLGRSVVLVLLGRMVGSGAASVEHGPGAGVWRWRSATSRDCVW